MRVPPGQAAHVVLFVVSVNVFGAHAMQTYVPQEPQPTIPRAAIIAGNLLQR